MVLEWRGNRALPVFNYDNPLVRREYTKVFDSTTVATAIADRLVFRSEILILGEVAIEEKRSN
jgi:hypothetical protein